MCLSMLVPYLHHLKCMGDRWYQNQPWVHEDFFQIVGSLNFPLWDKLLSFYCLSLAQYVLTLYQLQQYILLAWWVHSCSANRVVWYNRVVNNHSELEWNFCVGFSWEGLQVTHMVFAYHWTSQVSRTSEKIKKGQENFQRPYKGHRYISQKFYDFFSLSGQF